MEEAEAVYPENPELERTLSALHSKIDELTVAISDSKESFKREPDQERLSKQRRNNQTTINELSESLDDVSVKGHSPFYSQWRRMLYARLDALETKVTNLERRQTQMFQQDGTARKVSDLDRKICALSEVVHGLLADLRSLASPSHPALSQGQKQIKRYMNDITRFATELDACSTRNHPLAELAQQKRILYAKLDMLETLLDQEQARLNVADRHASHESIRTLESEEEVALSRGDNFKAAELSKRIARQRLDHHRNRYPVASCNAPAAGLPSGAVAGR